LNKLITAFVLIGLFAFNGVGEAANPQVGVSAALKGDVRLTRPSIFTAKKIESGEAIYINDIIITGSNAGMQILLLDETVFTIGGNSKLSIDTFIYNPETEIGQVTASVAKGVFRFITGKIAQKNPSNMKVKLPFGTIGVRGTIVAGKVDANGAEIMLLGPGDDNNTSETIGRIEVSNSQGSVVISRAGFGTMLGAATAPTKPVMIPEAQRSQLTQSLASKSGVVDTGNETGEETALSETKNANKFTGQSMATASVSSISTKETSTHASTLSDSSTIISQSIDFGDGSTSLSDLDRVSTGTYTFTGSSSLTNGGTYTISTQIDFGSRTVGGGNSYVSATSDLVYIGTIGKAGDPVVKLDSISFDSAIDSNASFKHDTIFLDAVGGGDPDLLDVNYNFENSGGAVAKIMNNTVTLTDGNDSSINGSGSSQITR